MVSALQAVEVDLRIDESLPFSTGFSYSGAIWLSIACSRGKEFRGVAMSGPLSSCVGGADPVAYYGHHDVSD
ncbi:hypothetical protein GGTG_13299 [Gaeumannomyces tritici R3-111a-1]|uniref:Uncharacterized protein n=1 Tax=Gaeumannomyces tritici (strain R3-111a-1) TaxID=644352 RepID=J3PIH1_GAET3|nr:hypothetical protein GGTG_13299 [Gaeumannomyces tritici R3-111a-1]EJT69190.1 hypothetical protein GGTG_13299 [Gaeumannomyces tritici R3-111a-1]